MIRFLDFNYKILIDFMGLALVYLVIFLPLWKKKKSPRLLLNSVMYLYISLVLYVTLMPVICNLPFIFDHPYVPMSMVPFEDYFFGRIHAVRQIILNVLMMVPFGFMLAIFKKRHVIWGAMVVVLATFTFSLFIELSQPLINPYRSSDVTDLITNTFGGLLGYLLYLLYLTMPRGKRQLYDN